MKQALGSPRGRVARGTVVGTAALKASARKAQVLLAEPFRSETSRALAAERADEDIAKILFDACCLLRGTSLKLAQVLATEYEELAPAFRDQFARAAHDAVPINRALVRRVIKAELGDWREHFSAFSDVPFAAASLGQVHPATSHDGEPLAVKIQYPGVAEGVASDLYLARAALHPTQWGPAFESCIGELRERLSEELDYCREAEHTAWFREHLHNRQVQIPRVYEQHCTNHVLTTERLPGQHLTAWLASSPSRDLREHYGQVLADVFHESIFGLHCIHADPNFGNYLFSNDGKLGLIDFGCVRKFDASALDTLRQAYSPQDDPQAIERLHAEMGIRYRASLPKAQLHEFLIRWSEWLSEPYRSERFDFSQKSFFERGAILGRDARRFVESCAGPFLYFGRATQGLFRLLQTLGVSVQMRLLD